jgi:hypothetical protein
LRLHHWNRHYSSDSPSHSSSKLLNGALVVLVLERRDQTLVLIGSRRARPAWLGAIPMTVLASLPLLGPGSLTAARLGGAAFLGAIALCWFVLAWPRRLVRRLERAGSALLIDGKRHEPIAVALGGVREDSSNSAPAFQVDLITTCSRVRILDGTDPARVLTHVEELASFLEVPIQPGWGLDAAALGAPDGRQPSAQAKPLEARGMFRAAQRGAAYTALGSTLFILCFLSTLILARYERGLALGTLSLVLPIVIVTYAFAVSLWLLGARSEVAVTNTSLEYRRLWNGRVLRTEAVPLDDLRGVFAVSPDGAEPTHLLSRVRVGFVAFPIVGEPARVLAAQFAPVTRSTERPARAVDAAETPGFSGARTASG